MDTPKGGVDYEKTLDTMVRFASICSILAIVSNLNLALFLMDLENTCLDGRLDEEVYMDLTISFGAKIQVHKMCHLIETIHL